MTFTTMFFCVLLAVAGSVAAAREQGTVTGSLTLNGKATKFSHVRAIKAEDWTFGEDRKPVLTTVYRVLLSDTPFDDLEDNFELSAMAKQGSLHALLFTINKKGEVLGGSVYHQASETGVENMFASRLDFQSKTVNDKKASGKLQTVEPMSLSAGNLEVKATFDTPYWTEPKPTAQGAAAAETAPAKVVQEFIKAAQAKNLSALKKVLRKEIADMLDKPEGQQAVMGMLEMSYPPELQVKIARVFDFGDRAWVEGDSKRKEESGKITDVVYRIRVIKANNDWKVSPL